MEVDDIISYHDLITEEKAALQKGMNYGVGKKYSIFLMSFRENARYADALDLITGTLKSCRFSLTLSRARGRMTRTRL